MKKHIIVLIACSLFIAMQNSYAQLDSLNKREIQFKKFYWGIQLNNLWSSVEGNTPEYFYKPSLGYFIKGEYYFTPFLGISVGAGYQQRGTGVINRNKEEVVLGTPDSTYRERLRFNYLDIPILLILRTPKPIAGGDVRLVGSFGIIPQKLISARDYFHSVEDGFHKITEVTENIQKNDMALTASVGAELYAGSNLFQVRLVGQWGTKSVYNNATLYPGYSGKNRVYGVQIAFMF
ncbi:PorT family protein [Rhodocytophaga rosea]|uniref:PorT family protein n=1 Tax=Rhodocytophaga rosea TaxID=2704465 RepID=A0A6C0GFQ6_9BACT|nr:outer membrane beta-barrel protein [Rhodocytophaga rosea]QHT66881.1 PorT family protein [Rhodocytophaga rosea]